MCFDRNINGNRDVNYLECDYLLVQRSMKLTLHVNRSTGFNLAIFDLTESFLILELKKK